MKQSFLHFYVMKHQNPNISIGTLPGNQKYSQMAYMLLNDNIRICLLTTQKIDKLNVH
jgi:hypothetical protein